MIDHKPISRDIERTKKALIRKAQRKGIYENFGQKEYRALCDKYGRNFYDRCTNGQLVSTMLLNFETWAMNYTGL